MEICDCSQGGVREGGGSRRGVAEGSMSSSSVQGFCREKEGELRREEDSWNPPAYGNGVTDLCHYDFSGSFLFAFFYPTAFWFGWSLGLIDLIKKTPAF